MSYLLEDKQYRYTFALCRGCRPDGAMAFGIAPSIERFLDRLGGQNDNAEVLKRIYADHTHNLDVSWLEVRPALARMIRPGPIERGPQTQAQTEEEKMDLIRRGPALRRKRPPR